MKNAPYQIVRSIFIDHLPPDKKRTGFSIPSYSIVNRICYKLVLFKYGASIGMAESADDLCSVTIMDLDGKIIESSRKPSSEWWLHGIFYKNRPEIFSYGYTVTLDLTSTLRGA